MKQLGLISIILNIIFISGCGGGGSSNNNGNSVLANKPFMIIQKNSTNGVCEQQIFKNALSQSGFIGILTEEKSNSISCADYGKTNNGNTCYEYNYTGTNQGNVACVIGFDSQSERKKVDFNYNNIIVDTIDTLFIQIAE